MNTGSGNAHRQQGLSLIELMVAMVLGLLVTAGIITIFLSTSSSNRAQAEMAVLQENGRFAINRIASDVALANALYCSGSGGAPQDTAGGIRLDKLRSPTVFASGGVMTALSDVTTPWGGMYPAAPTQAYALPEFLYMRGYDCTAGACQPEDPNTRVAGIPRQGTDIGDRVVGSSILTIRYLNANRGWSIGEGGSSITPAAGNIDSIAVINLAPKAGEPPVTDFGANSLAMLADCSAAQVFAVTGQGSPVLIPQTVPGGNFSAPGTWSGLTGVRLFDFGRDFQTVTYYLKVVDMGAGQKTGALIRRLNGVDEELVRGIERMNFRYGVLDSDGNTRLLTAAQVDGAAPASCPPMAPPPEGGTPPGGLPGCLWRSVTTVEVSVLATGLRPLPQLTESDLSYTYVFDGQTTPAVPDAHSIRPVSDQGFPKSMLRREFVSLLAIRNYNP